MATRLFHISDLHFGAEDPTALAKVERAIQEESPDIVVCTGDLTQRATHDQFKAAAQWFSQFEVPVWLDPGNHDMPYYNIWERLRQPYRRYNAMSESVAVPTFETEDLVLIPLKTTVRMQSRWPWVNGFVTPNALRAAMSELERLGNDPRLRIVTAHHPLQAPRPGHINLTIGGDHAFERLSEAGMNAVLTGHVHHPFNEHRSAGHRSAQMIGAGTLSTRLRNGAPASYNALTYRNGDNEIAVETRIVGAHPTST